MTTFSFVASNWLVKSSFTFLWFTMIWFTVYDAVAEPKRITHFEVLRSSQNILTNPTEWENITLPDSWQEQQTREQPFTNSWYRKILSPSDITFPFAVYIPRVSMNVSVAINGREIGSSGRFSEPISRNHGRPLIFYIPDLGYADQQNIELLIRVADNSWAFGYLGPVYIGDPGELTDIFHKREFLQVQLTIGLALLMLIFSIASFTLYSKRTKDKHFLWFGAAMLLFSIDTLNVFVINIPVERKTFEIYNQTIIFAFACATLLFIHRFTHVGWKYSEPIMGMLLVAKPLILLLVNVKQLFLVASILNIIVIVYGLLLAVAVIAKYIQTSSFETGITAISGLILLSVAFHTWLVQIGVFDPENLHIIHYGAPSFFLLISLSLVRRFLTSLQDTEELAASLETRVQQKKQALSESYKRLNKMEHERTLTEERSRIMREVHDGFGGQLIGALTMLENKDVNRAKLSEHLKHSLLDLRAVIDSLDPSVQEVSVAFGMLRSRIEPILNNRHISLIWDMHNLPLELTLKPNETLSLLRIIQELITNIVKHSNTTEVLLKVATEHETTTETLCIILRENGNGFDHSLQSGKGLKNIQKRVNDLKGQISYEAQNDSFTTTIWIPVKIPKIMCNIHTI